MSDPRLPGQTGLPLIGETLEFVKDTHGFTARRRAEHGPVFLTHLLGKATVVISGPEAGQVWTDPALIARSGAMPELVQEIFAGESLPQLDGDAHRVRKAQVRQALNREALEAYTPMMTAQVRAALERQAQGGSAPAVPGLKTLAIATLLQTLFEVTDPDEVALYVQDYGLLTAGLRGVPVNLPGTGLNKGLRARDRILARLEALIAARRVTPTRDGLSRMLTAEAPDGSVMHDLGARNEAHHLILAGYIIFGLFVGGLVHLREDPELVKGLRAELLEHAPQGISDPAVLLRMPRLRQVVMELKRHTPITNAFFGRARTDFDIDGHRVREGVQVMLAITDGNMASETWDEPGRFDPQRFSKDRAEHKRHAEGYAPQGPGEMASSHKCAGLQFTSLFLSVFLVELLRGWEWSLPEQDLSLDMALIPPEPRGGLVLELTPAAR